MTWPLDRRLLHRLPFPLAVLLEQIKNAESAADRGALTVRLAESYLKLAAAVVLAEALASGAHQPAGIPALKNLSSPSLCDFESILRLMSQRVRDEGSARTGASVAHVAEALLTCRPESTWRYAADALSEGTASTADLAFIDILKWVAVRSDLEPEAVMGEPESRGLYDAIVTALADLQLDPTRGHLCYVGKVERTDGGWRAERWELSGTRPLRAGWERVGSEASGITGQVCVWESGKQVLPLFPLVVFVGAPNGSAYGGDPPDFAFLSSSHTTTDYFSPLSGRRIEERTTESLRSTLARMTGEQIDSTKHVRSQAEAHSAPLVLQRGDTVTARYRIERLLGRGGMGAVYEAYDELKQRRCALKLARPTPGVEQAEFSQRFKREAQIGAQLGERIEGVVTAFDFNSLDDGRLFLALDLVEGARDLDLTNGPLSARIERLGRAAAVVAKLHQHGVIHRDLKPANFVQDAEGRVYLTDFGLAKRLGDAEEEPALDGLLTRGGVRMGTPYFMPPEQFRNAGAVDKRADVYALGTMLYLALTGEYPYSVPVAERQAEVWEGMCAPPDPSQIVEALPPALVDVCLKSLELFASKRLASAQEFCTALAPFASPGHSEDPLATGVLHVANEGALSTGQGLDSATRPGLRASPAGREATRQQKRGSPSRPIPQGPADELQLVPLPEDLPRDQPPLPAEEFLHVDSFVTGVTSARDQDEQPADLGLELAAQGSSSFEADSSGAPPQGDPGYCEVCALPLPPTHDSVLCTECQVTEALLEGSTLQDSGAVVIRQAAVHLGVSNPEPASGADPAGLAEPSEALSSRVPCPGCASSLQLPPPGSQTFVQCPTCGSRFRVATQGASEAWTAQPDTAPSELPTFRISGLDRQGLRFHNRKIQARTGMEAIEQAKELGFRLDGYPMKVRPARQKKSATNRKRVEAADERSAATEDQSVPEENFAPAGDGSWALSALVGLPICYVLGLAPFWWIGDLLGFGAKITRDSGVLFFGLWLVILVIAATLVLGAAAPMLLVAGLTLAGLEDRKARSFAAALLGVGLALCVLPFGVNPNSSLIGYFGIQVAVGVGCAGGLGVLAADADSPYTWRRGVLHAGVALALPATLLAGCAAYAALNDWHGSSDVFALVVCVVLLSIGLFGVLLASDLGGMAKLVAALVIVAVVFFIYQFSSAKTYARRKLVYEPIAAAAQARIQPIETHLAKLGVLPEFASLDRSPLHVGILGGGEQTFAVSYEALSGESFRMQVLVKQLADKKFELSYMPETGWAFPDH